MPASVVQTASVATNSAATTTATFAGTPASGNIIVAHVVADSQVTGPAGYTLRGSINNDFSAYVWDKTAAASEPKTVTITYTGTVPAVLTIIELAGVSGFDVISAARSISSSPRTTNGVTSVTSNANPTGSFVLALSCQHDFVTKPTTPVWNNSFSNLALTGSGGGTGSGPVLDCNVFVATRTVTTSTTIGLTTLSWTNSATDVNAWHIAYTAGAVTAPPPPPTASTFLLEVDFPQTGTWSDITTYVDSLTIRRGRQRETDQVAAGSLAASLMNDTKRFTPGNTTGAYYPNVKPERPIRFSVNTGTQVFLFTGTTDQFTMAWEGGRLATANVLAADGFKTLARRTSANLYAETIFNRSTCTAYYPLSEPAGSIGFANAQPANPLPPAALNASKYGAGTFVAGDLQGFMAGGAPASTCCTFTHTGTGNTEGMTVIQLAGGPVTNGIVPPANGPWSWSCWFKIAAAPPDSMSLLYARGAPPSDPSLGGGFASTGLSMTSAGKINFQIINAAGTTVSVTTVAAYADSVWHRATGTVAADNKTLNLFVDSTTATTVGGTAVTLAGMSWFVAAGALTPWAQSSGGLNGSLACVELYNVDLDVLVHQSNWLIGRDGSYILHDTGQVVLQYAQNAGYGTLAAPFIVADVGVTTTTAKVDITGQTYLAAMQTMTDTEQGVLYVRGDGSLIFKNRGYRVNQPSAFILDCNNGDIDIDATFGIDETLLANDYSAVRPGGGPQRVRDVASTNEFGIFTNAPTPSGAQTVLLTTDSEVNDYAAYKVAQYSQPKPRTPGITIDLLTNPGLWQVVQFIDIGTRFTIVNLPAEAPSATMDLIAEGLTWSFVPGQEVKLHLDTSPVDTTPYFTLDDTVYGLLDSNNLFF